MSPSSATIAALATPPGCAALAVIRISGSDAFSIVQSCLAIPSRFNEVSPRVANVLFLSDPVSKKNIDQVVAIKYVAPFSYTGEDLVEINCHGGQYIVDRILGVFISLGARYAQPGEFTLRAFKNGKMSLSTAESIQELIVSRSDLQHETALNTYSGTYQRILEALKNAIFDAISEVEALIEFPEEDDLLEKGSVSKTVKTINAIENQIKLELQIRTRIKTLEQGFRVVIAGRPNVGKSSLFNFLLQKERSLVHWESGTTRDYISEQVLICGVEVVLIDTAGIHIGNSVVEEMGIGRSRELISTAQVLLLLCSAEHPWSEWEESILRQAGDVKRCIVINKCDLPNSEMLEKSLVSLNTPIERISLLKDINTGAVIRFIESAVTELKGESGSAGIIINQRQEALMLSLQESLSAARNSLYTGLEIGVEHLKAALSTLDEFCGTTSNEEIINNIFNKFCIGK